MHKYTDEQRQFIQENYKGTSTKELVRYFNQRFSTDITESMMKSYKSNHKLNSGLTGRFSKGHVPANKGKKGHCAKGCEKTWFSKGHIPATIDPIGTEKLLGDGYVWVKVDDKPNVPKRKNWIQKHVLIWEQANGSVPKGHCLIFLDGDRSHIELDNLMLISRGTLAILNRQGLIRKDANLTRTGVQIAKLIQAISHAKQNNECADYTAEIETDDLPF